MLTIVLVVLLVVGVLIVIPWLASSMERSSGEGGSGASNPFGVMEEIFHPAAHEASLVQMEAKEVVAQDPVPDDEEPGLDGPRPRD